jgi:3-demethoxyubiquinol 3-hydroxylase
MNKAFTDRLILQCDLALRTLHSLGQPQRTYPPIAASKASHVEPSEHSGHSEHSGLGSRLDSRAEGCNEPGLHTIELSAAQRQHSAGLMRVNHVGEVCAQALYAGQSLAARSPAVKQFNQQAALEERDHLLWTAQRLKELKAKPSVLNPVWYAGAWGLGVVAGLLGDKTSLAFVQETEAQVEAHLHTHEALLPSQDLASLAIVRQMKHDEAEHGAQAQALGAVALPKPVQLAMRASAKLMTSTAYYL